MKMKKRFLSILLSLSLVLGLMPGMGLTAFADNQFAYTFTATSTSDWWETWMCYIASSPNVDYSKITKIEILVDMENIVDGGWGQVKWQNYNNEGPATYIDATPGIRKYTVEGEKKTDANCAIVQIVGSARLLGYVVYEGDTVLASGGTMDIPELTVPQAITGLKESGSAQALVTEGTATAGSIEYSLDNTTWSTDVPKAKDKGNYTVYYRLKYGNNNDKTYTSLHGEKGISVTIDEAEEYPLWVGGTQVTSANASDIPATNGTKSGTASYNDETKTLTLNNYSYRGAGYVETNLSAAIYASQELTISLTGDSNTVTNVPEDGKGSFGVYVSGNLTITGSGTLTANAGDTTRNSSGIYVAGYKQLIIDSEATVRANGGNAENTQYTRFSRGVYAGGNITVKGMLEATSASGGESYGVQAYDGSLTIASGGSVNATAGESSKSIGLSAAGSTGLSVAVDGTLIAKGNTSALGRYGSATTYTVLDGQTVTESANYDGSGSTTVAVGDTTANTSKYVKIAPTAKEEAEVTKAPTAKTLTYTGSAQELVTEGEATGGTLYYAVTTENTAPAENLYTTSIPAKTDAGTYYVWYKVVGDDNHSDTEAAPVTVTIARAAAAASTVTANNRDYDGTEKPLVTVNDSTLAGGTMQYALGTDAATAPAEGWKADIPAATGAGTYYVWYKAVGNAGYTDTEPECITVTIKEQPAAPSSAPSVPMIIPFTPVPAPAVTPAPAAVSTAAPATAATPARAAEAYTVPVSNENTVDLSVNISDGNAVVQEITQADLDKIMETSAETGNGGDNKADDTISIDVSGAKSEVTSVELSSTSIERLAKTVEASERVDSVEIKMTNATVELDGAAVSAVSEQKEGNTVKLVVENKEQTKLNETQKEALKNFTSVQPFQAYFESAGKEIHDFKGGKATVSIRFTPETGKDVKHYHMYYVPLNGLIERYVTRYLNGMLTFVTTHFSDYAIVYDETVENETGKEDTTASPVPSETAIPATAPTAEPDGQPDATATPAPAVSAEEKATAALDLNAGLKVIHKGKTVTVQWGEVDGADFYRVYAGYCGGKVSLVKTVKSGAKCKVTMRTLNGKKLNTTKNIKVYVAAYRKAAVTGGTGTVTKNVRIAKTITGHVVGKSNTKYSNAKKIMLEKSSCTLKKGKKAQIKATTVLEYPKRKQLSDAHAKEFRYATSDKSIAAVSKTGKITAKKKGNCVIYVYARNGLAKKIKVTVMQ